MFRPIHLLRAEALCLLVAACGAFHVVFPHHWLLFVCLFLLPDLSLLVSLGGPSAVASGFYNLMHNYVLPGVLGILAAPLQSALLGELSLIWIAHISLDRMLGYGLKYPTSFKFTHIQSADNPRITVDEPGAPGKF